MVEGGWWKAGVVCATIGAGALRCGWWRRNQHDAGPCNSWVRWLHTHTRTFTLSSLVRHNPHATRYIVGVYLVAMTLLWAENDVPPAVRWMMSFFLSFLLVMGHRMVGSTSVFKQLAIITSPELCQRETHTHIHIHPAMPIGQVRTGSERAGSQETHGRSRIAFWWVMGFFVTAHRYMPFFDDAPACDARTAVW